MIRLFIFLGNIKLKVQRKCIYEFWNEYQIKCDNNYNKMN